MSSTNGAESLEEPSSLTVSSLQKNGFFPHESHDGGDFIVRDNMVIIDEIDQVWICALCQNQNPIQVHECGNCRSIRTNEDFLVPHLSKDSIREVSGKKLVADEITQLYSDSSDGWTCMRCTLKNSAFALICEVCGAALKNDLSLHSSSSYPASGNTSDSPSHKRSSEDVPTAAKKSLTKEKLCDIIMRKYECDAQAQSVIWICQVCTYNNNPKFVDVCDICYAARGSHGSGSEVTDKHSQREKYVPNCNEKDSNNRMFWKCTRCSTKNHSIMGDCIACGTPQMSKNSKTAGPAYLLKKETSWTCSKCTLLNSETAHICGACQSKKETYLPTVDDPKLMKESGQCSLKWLCVTCTFLNTEDWSKCAMCSQQRNGCQAVASVEPKPVAIPSFHFTKENSICMKEQIARDEETAKTQWMEIVKFCKEQRHSFVDDSFPPIPQSLFYSPEFHPNVATVRWMRLSEIPHEGRKTQGNWTIFQLPKPTDIVQGLLGNCWFLSSLSVLAERPSLLEKILITKEFCQQGVYQIHLCLDGNWKTILIDDLFPCNLNGQLVYSQAKRKQLWVPLIEKALAKIHGCYEALSSGRCIEGLSTLTGAPCESLQLNRGKNGEDLDFIWAKLLSSRESGFLMGASCGSGNMKVDDTIYKDIGLISRHAYSILDVQNVEGHRLLRFRNPWGKFSWKGDWSDGSKLWDRITTAKRKELTSDRVEGVFWMSLQDVMQFFDSVDICKYRSDWMESRVNGILPVNSEGPSLLVTQIEVFETTEIDLGLFQEGTRGREKSKRNPVDLCICVFRSSDAGNQLMGTLITNGQRQIRSFVGCSCILEPGTYTVLNMAFNHWLQTTLRVPKCTLTIHSSKGLLVEQKALPSVAMADSIIQLAISKGERHEGREGMTTYYLTRNWAGFIMVVENRNPYLAVHVRCDCSSSVNVVSTRAALKTVDSVPPLHRQVIILLTQLESSNTYSISHHLKHRTGHVRSGLGDWGSGDSDHVPELTAQVFGLHSPRPL